MNTAEIQRRSKFIHNANGKTVEVILPYKIYQELLELTISLEIYQQEDVQQSIRQAKKDIEDGNWVCFKTMDEAFEWLNR